MSIERVNSRIVYLCDACPDTLDTDERDWYKAKKIFDEDGWHATHDGDDWCHYCGDCWRKKQGK